MCITVNIQKGTDIFEFSLESQNTVVIDNGSESKALLLELIGRFARAVKVNTSNEFGIDLIDLSSFDNSLNRCLNTIQRKYFSMSEEGKERFYFFKISSEPKNKERYQRMVENYWKEQIDEQKNNEGGKIIFVNCDEDFINSVEFKALYKMDKLNYYVLLMNQKLYNDAYKSDVLYQFARLEDKHIIKKLGS